MWSFYTIIVIVAVIILIIALTIVGITLAKKQNNIHFPEFQTACPDFWTVSADTGKCIPNENNNSMKVTTFVNHSDVMRRFNHKGVTIEEAKPTAAVRGNGSTVPEKTGSAKVTEIDISEDNWVSVCDKSTWAKNAGILWDGVTNNNTCS